MKQFILYICIVIIHVLVYSIFRHFFGFETMVIIGISEILTAIAVKK